MMPSHTTSFIIENVESDTFQTIKNQ